MRLFERPRPDPYVFVIHDRGSTPLPVYEYVARQYKGRTLLSSNAVVTRTVL
jgi:hypothetical protein